VDTWLVRHPAAEAPRTEAEGRKLSGVSRDSPGGSRRTATTPSRTPAGISLSERRSTRRSRRCKVCRRSYSSRPRWGRPSCRGANRHRPDGPGKVLARRREQGVAAQHCQDGSATRRT